MSTTTSIIYTKQSYTDFFETEESNTNFSDETATPTQRHHREASKLLQRIGNVFKDSKNFQTKLAPEVYWSQIELSAPPNSRRPHLEKQDQETYPYDLSARDIRKIFIISLLNQNTDSEPPINIFPIPPVLRSGAPQTLTLEPIKSKKTSPLKKVEGVAPPHENQSDFFETVIAAIALSIVIRYSL